MGNINSEQLSLLEQQLAESQTREKGLRDALELVGDSACGEASHQYTALTALAQPTNDTALKALLAAERERCAKQCDWYGSYHKENYPGDPSLFISAEDCAEAIRALGD